MITYTDYLILALESLPRCFTWLKGAEGHLPIRVFLVSVHRHAYLSANKLMIIIVQNPTLKHLASHPKQHNLRLVHK